MTTSSSPTSSQFDANTNPSPVFRMYKKLSKKPGGKALFSAAVSLKAPYFSTVLPRLQEMHPGYSEVKVPKWWLVNNHIKTFHAIAACNAAEFAMGMLAEASLPNTHRWLPKGMRTEYRTKSKGGLTARASADLPDFSQITRESGGQTLTVTIHFEDAAGNEPVYAEIDIWVTAKK
ncbi:hotdog fold domain-containing protein [Corynebacterium sp. HMSC28B08]|uniref:hotdog fold domain-containing protein n=1 Tax=Corynebacterium sp. HMSC28B08 TaxID=1581066 RepID=UPI0008A2B862|nr:hotdog fold domain-containing protein [Corynebacterium sp. HMSC28B08]OFT89265.1 thioesterase [Corynebacterium sp. HMSC28B08]